MVFSVLCMSLFVIPGEAEVLTLSPTADTTLVSNSSQGASSKLKASGSQRPLVRFDISSLETIVGAQIQSAWLELYLEELKDWPTAGRWIGVHRVTQDWSELTANWSCASGTTVCASAWSGGAFLATASGTAEHVAGQAGWVRLNVTADLAAFLSQALNFGWMLRLSDGGTTGTAIYTSREGVAAQRPRLVVTYLPDTAPPALTVNAPAPVVRADGTPDIVVEFSDAQAGVDLDSLEIKLDGNDMTSACSRGPAAATCASSLIEVGAHAIEAKIQDRAGNLATVSASFEMRFTVDHAWAQAVSFATSEFHADQMNGLDSRGAIVWTSSPRATWGYRLDTAGSLLEQVDALGNRTVFSRDAEGNQQERRHEYNNAGSWTERLVPGADGTPFLQAVEVGPTDLPRKLAMLGIAPGTTPAAPTTTVTEGADGSTTEVASSFGRSSHWQRTDLLNVPDGVPYLRETTEALGRSLAAWMEVAPEGIVVQDDRGGWRLQTYDELNRLVTVDDDEGPVLSILHDAEGRQTEVYAGEVALIRYLYQPDGRWIKELVDRRTGEVVYRLYCAQSPGEAYQQPQDSYYQPQRRTQAFLSPSLPIVEWDPDFSWDGHLLASLGGEPYALVPLDGQSTLWRSVTTRAGDGFFQERIDYSANQVVIHLATDAGGPDGERQSVAIALPRRAAAEPSTASATRSVVAPFTSSKAPLFNAEFCNFDCICVTRPRRDGVEIIVRCPRSPVPGNPGIGDGGPRGPGGGGGRNPQGPRDLGPGASLPPGLQFKLNQGKRLASQKLTSLQTCRDLFSSFQGNFRDGNWILGSHVQFSNGDGKSDASGRVPCDESGVPAWTVTNSRHVYICDSFRNLGQTGAAITVLHELLHVAGLRENPPDASAPTSREINVMVQRNCSL